MVDPAVAQRLPQRLGDVVLADDLGERLGPVAAVQRERGVDDPRAILIPRAAAAAGTGDVACRDLIRAVERKGPPRTRQSPLTLAAFRPWGSWAR